MSYLVDKIKEWFPFVLKETYNEELEQHRETKRQLQEVVKRTALTIQTLERWEKNEIGNIRALNNIRAVIFTGDIDDYEKQAEAIKLDRQVNLINPKPNMGGNRIGKRKKKNKRKSR